MAYSPKAGDSLALDLANRSSSVATLTALKAIGAKKRHLGLMKLVEADGSLWRFHDSSSLNGDDVLVVQPSSGSGRWLRMPGATTLVMPFTYATADATALLTLQAGQRVLLRKFFWTVSADFTGGSSSAIGVSSGKTGFSTKGDLLGGAAGDVAATLVASTGTVNGTIGVKMDTVGELHTALFVSADTIRFDRITSAFSAGTGAVNLVCDIVTNDGA